MPNNILIDNTFTYDDLLETAPGNVSDETASFSWEESDARIVYNEVPGEHLIDALMLIEGYAYTESVAGVTKMHRKNSMRHPKFPWMRANKVESVEGYGGLQSTVTTFNNYTTNGDDVQSKTNRYAKYRIAVSFNQPDYNILTDDELSLLDDGNERLRYCYVSGTETTTSAIVIQGGAVKFKAGQFNPAANSEVSAPSHNIYETIQTIKLVWTKVAEDYVQSVASGDPLGGTFYRLNAGLNCVNSTTFLGRRPGTMLMDPFAYRRKRMPVRTSDGTQPFWCEIEFVFRYFDPTPGPAVGGGGGCTNGYYGWLLAPNASRQYYAVEVPGVGGNATTDLYLKADFNRLFFPDGTATP